ncbi:hypothetical protein N5K35_25270 [Pseudomonas sp. GD03651]|nr:MULTISPECIES: hypothetical protein [Pseudomonas]AGN82010.1 hypothetical protein L483_13100 [Pseudomonas putida H8234]MDH2187001.1 hypothetical protein [Pseudomonas sp. GD03651]
MTGVLIVALAASCVGLLLQRREIRELEAEHERLCKLLQEDRP